ncbi:ribonuclease H-like domain-containing protein [Tanacetum coccineum]
MSVHNSEHNTPNNFDHDDDIYDYVTRISKLDISDPLHLHPNDTIALTVVSIKLKRTKNYQVWSCAMLLALECKNKIGFIDGSCKRSNEDEVLGKQWDRNGSSIADYYHKLNALWKQYDAMIELPKCVCNASKGFKKHNQLLKLMQFLMSLDDSYMQIRSSILSRETLPDVRSAYATISSEESHRVVVGSIAGSSQRNQASAFVQGGGSGLNNNRPSGGSGLVCENCGFNGHTIDRCFKIIGYPADFGKKKSGQNFKKQSVSNNNFVGKSSSSEFTDEQMATLIFFIKENKVGKNVQHMTYTDKELDNVLDIAYLKIKVGHPNGTEAYISKIRNLRLSNGLTLYDMMVIPEYCVTLTSVHKLIKDNKHDWHCMLGHPADPVLNVLKDSLNIDKKDNTICCEIYPRAKQTRELFPLSDHKSKSLGDLVHLDLWGPYKVTSSEGFRVLLIKRLVCHNPKQKGIAEEKRRHLLNVARSLLFQGGIPLRMWTKDVKFFENIFPFKDSQVGKNDSTNVFQDVNHINFFDIEYPEMPNDDERVANDLNKGKRDISSSSVSGSNINTADFPVDSRNDHY